MPCPECSAYMEDNVRIVELLVEIEQSEAWDHLPAWLQAAIVGEMEEAGSYRQSVIDMAERRGREGARQQRLIDEIATDSI